MLARSRRTSLAIDLGRNTLRAVRVRHGRSMQVAATVMESLPEAIDREDSRAVGQWLRRTLDAGGLGHGDAIFALERDIASLKILELPTTDRDELPGMVRLAVERDLPIDADEAVIDYTVVSRGEATTRVQAVAVSRREIHRLEEIAEVADIPITGITLRCLGSAELVRLAGGDSEVGSLVIDVTGEGLEILLVRDGEVQFSRGVGVQGPDGMPPTGEQLVVETRRSWLSYRVSRGDMVDPEGILLGGKLAASIVDEISECTGLDVRAFEGNAAVERAKDMTGVWPLVGLLKMASGKEQLDLADPRKEPDRAARIRQRILMAAGLSLVFAGIGWTIGNRGFTDEAARAQDLKGKADKALSEHLRFLRDEFRADHLESWIAVRPDWLEHLLVVGSPRLGEATVVLDQFGGTLLAEPTEYTSSKEWVTEASSRLTVEG
ncbi:MAG: hypothetical protein MK085_03290, partial [Phycisphaerales bacterium]|nr:hypothetical protein [Phycisphaerales bacterium]